MFALFLVTAMAIFGFGSVDQCAVDWKDSSATPVYDVDAYGDGKTRWNPDPAKRCE